MKRWLSELTDRKRIVPVDWILPLALAFVCCVSARASFVTSGIGSGDVVGPASATDNGFCRMDGTTGKLLQDTGTGASLSDTGVGTFPNIIDSGLTASTAVYSNGSKQFTSLAAGTNGDVMMQASGIPSWAAQSTLAAGTAAALAANPADCAANTFANAIAASGALTCANPFTGFVETWGGHVPVAEDKTYKIIPSAPVAMQVVSFTAHCASGSITGKLQIAAADGSGAADITTCTAVSIGTTQGTVTTCDTGSSNDLAAGKQVWLVTSSNSTCLDLIPSVKTTRD